VDRTPYPRRTESLSTVVSFCVPVVSSLRVLRYGELYVGEGRLKTEAVTEYKCSIALKHNTLISVIQCYMFLFNKTSSGTILQKLEKNISTLAVVSDILLVLKYLLKYTVCS
jgi:hypothetical protein